MSLRRPHNEEGGVDTENGIYVEMSGVMEVRVVDADGTILQRQDFEDFQAETKSIPLDFCHKDADGVQALFFCLVCNCDLKHIVPLKSHVEGNKHIRKALAFKQRTYGHEPEPVNQPKKIKIAAPKKKVDVSEGLEQRLLSHDGPILGLHFIEEFVKPGDTPYYSCTLNGCKKAWGNSDDMFNHIKNHKHIRNFFADLYPDDDRINKFNKNDLTAKALEFTQRNNNLLAEDRNYDSIIVVRDRDRYDEISNRPKDWSEKKEKIKNSVGGGAGSSFRGGASNNPNLQPLGYKDRGIYNEAKWKEFKVPADMEEAKANSRREKSKILQIYEEHLRAPKRDIDLLIKEIEHNITSIDLEIEIMTDDPDDLHDLRAFKQEMEELKRKLTVVKVETIFSQPVEPKESDEPSQDEQQHEQRLSASQQRQAERQKYEARFKTVMKQIVLDLANKLLTRKGKSANDIDDICDVIVTEKIMPREVQSHIRKNQEWKYFVVNAKRKIRAEEYCKDYFSRKY